MGAKGKYMPKYAEKAKELIAQGIDKKETAKKLGISIRTLFYWKEKNPEFADKLDEGEEIFWTMLGLRMLDIMAEGYCRIEVAAEFGISVTTLDDWVKDENKLKPYWDIGHTASFAWWWKKVRVTLDDPKANRAAVALLIWKMKVSFGLFDNLLMENMIRDVGVSDKEIIEAEVRLKRIIEIERKSEVKQVECSSGT